MSRQRMPKAAKKLQARAVPRAGKHPSIAVLGTMSRAEHLAFQTSIYVPQAIRDRIESRLDDGSFSTALLALAEYALDALDAAGMDLVVSADAENVTSREE